MPLELLRHFRIVLWVFSLSSPGAPPAFTAGDPGRLAWTSPRRGRTEAVLPLHCSSDQFHSFSAARQEG